jgi:hypothetical protein
MEKIVVQEVLKEVIKKVDRVVVKEVPVDRIVTVTVTQEIPVEKVVERARVVEKMVSTPSQEKVIIKVQKVVLKEVLVDRTDEIEKLKKELHKLNAEQQLERRQCERADRERRSAAPPQQVEIVTEKQVPFIKKVIKEIIKEVSAEEWDRLLKSRYRWKYKSLSSGLCKFLWRRLFIETEACHPQAQPKQGQ